MCIVSSFSTLECSINNMVTYNLKKSVLKDQNFVVHLIFKLKAIICF